MKAEIKKAVETLVASYGDVKREAASYGDLNADDIKAALAESTPDTAEYYVLTLLAAQNVTSGKPATKVVNDVVKPKSVINE